MKKYIFVSFLFIGTVLSYSQFLESKTELEPFNGFFNFHYAKNSGEIYLEVDKLETDFLYVHSLRTGLGSNDIGLDRGQLGAGVLVKFVKSGNTLLLVQPNLKYRANTENQLEKRSIEEAFARSVLFGFPIKETKGETYIIDLTPFIMLDAHGISRTLKRNKEGDYKLEKSRSSLWMERTKAFPKNIEFEALLTFVGDPKSRNLRSVSPDASSISVIQHHSFVELPKNNYQPRQFDPRCGSYPMSYMDYSTPIWEPIVKRFITRHHLEKTDSNLAKSSAKEPIIYYLDPGTPEPVRSALLEGGKWWNQAFESIGYIDAFQVKMLPPEADPMDLRYNVIQWVHRSTRGWSYGSTITDPRTGEILKGHVSLGSLRIRQDFMIAQALMDKPFAERDDNHDQMLNMALARIKQLSAHEIGHTIGFAHNFAASTNNRASVMDYPYPNIELKNGKIDFSNAYAQGIGDWDKVSVAYSYSEFSENLDEKTALNSILEAAFAKGLRFISDSDARPTSGAHAKAHLWDNGKDPVTELNNLLDLRAVAISNFSEDNIRTGDPYTALEDVFVPLYFYHRYQTEAAVKIIGGMEYDYLVKGYNGIATSNLPRETQLMALTAIFRTLDVLTLTIPKDKLALFPPRAYGYQRSRESFKSNNGVAFDALGAAATASDMTLQLLLNPARLNRIVEQNSMNKENSISVLELLNGLIDKVFLSQSESYSSYEKEVMRTVQYRTLLHILNLIVSGQTIVQVKAMSEVAINRIKAISESKGTQRSRSKRNSDKNKTKEQEYFYGYLIEVIDEFKEHPERFKLFTPPKIPDGSPIGSFQCYYNN